MFFQKQKLRKKYDESLLTTLTELKKEWNMKRTILDKGIDNSEDVEFDFQISEAKYFFYITEAKKRKINCIR